MSETALVHFTQARQALQKAKRIDEVIKIRDAAERMRVALRQAKEAPEMVNDAVEIKVRAERRAGEMLKEGAKKGDRVKRGKNKTSRNSASQKSHDATSDTPTLAEIGISKTQSSRWQAIAEIPEEKFEEKIQEIKETPGAELTTQALLNVAKEDKKQKKREERIAKVVSISEASAGSLSSVGQFPVVYADPPWRYDFSVDEADEIENHYPTMTLEEICALPVGTAATDDCVLLLWATSPKLEEAFAVINAWGFTYRTCAVWDKEWIGPGYYFRQRHELLLVATKGSLPVPLPSNRPDSIFAERRTKHSKKPKIAYELIEQMYPELPKLELFSRNPREGWTAWGNEVARKAVA